MSILRSERGAAIVELPFAIGIVLLLGMGAVTLVQMTWTHLNLSSAVRTATRYATHVDYDPVAGGIERHRTAEQVRAWVVEVAEEAGVAESDVTVVGTHYPCGTPSDTAALALPMVLTAAQLEPPITTTTLLPADESTTTTTLLSDLSTTTTLLPDLSTATTLVPDLSTTTTLLPDPLPLPLPEADCTPVETTVIEDLVAGDEITITVEKTVSNPLYQIAASITNVASNLFGAGDAFNPDGVDVNAGAVTYVE